MIRKCRLDDFFHFEVRESFMINEMVKYIGKYGRPLLLTGYSHIPTIMRKIRTAIKGVKVRVY